MLNLLKMLKWFLLESRGFQLKVTELKINVKLLLLELIDICLISNLANWIKRTIFVDINDHKLVPMSLWIIEEMQYLLICIEKKQLRLTGIFEIL